MGAARYICDNYNPTYNKGGERGDARGTEAPALQIYSTPLQILLAERGAGKFLQ